MAIQLTNITASNAKNMLDSSAKKTTSMAERVIDSARNQLKRPLQHMKSDNAINFDDTSNRLFEKEISSNDNIITNF